MSLPVPPTTADRLMAAIRALMRGEDPLRDYRGLTEYVVQTVSGDNKSCDLAPADTSVSMPALRNVPIRSGVAGLTAQPAQGSKCYVAFANADPSKPVIVAYDIVSAGTNGFTPAPNGAVVCYGDIVTVGSSSGAVTPTGGQARSIRAM